MRKIKNYISSETSNTWLFKVLVWGMIVFFGHQLQAAPPACGGTATFTNPATGCVGSKIKFTFSSTGPAVNNYIIDFGDGNDSTVNAAGSIDYIYTSAAKYYIKYIRVVGACKDTTIDSITISNKPSAAFSILNDSICSGSIDSFNTAVSVPTYSWKFSNGSTALVQNPGLSFTTGASPTTITAKLITTNGNGCSDSTTKNFVVMPLPVVAYTYTGDSSCSGTTLSFTNSSSGATNYIWRFSDGNISNTANTSHIYTNLGNGFAGVWARLTATTAFGCSDSLQKNITVKQKPDGSVADYTNSPVYTFCNIGNFDLQVDDSSTTAATDSTHWFYWGDGAKDSVINFNGGNISHSYTTKGFFTLQVTTIGKNKCTNTRSYTVFNGGNPSVGLASPGGTTGLCAPTTLKFPLTSYSGNPNGTVYTVSSNDGSPNQVYNHPPPDTIVWTFKASSCNYTSQGGFSNALHIKITAQNPCGTSQATVEPITLNKKPIADFSISPDTIVCKNATVTFTDNSTPGSVIPGGGGACGNTYKRFWQLAPLLNWDTIGGTKLGNPSNWFNNNPSTQGSAALQVQFTDTGTFQIKLIVANPGLTCGSDTIIKTVKVVNPPVPKFRPSPDSGCVNLIDTFINQSKGDGLKYKWTLSPNFGFTYQGSYSDTSTNPVVSFNSSGIYIITLAVTNPCTTLTYIDTVIVKKKPTVSFNSISSGCKTYIFNPSATFNGNNSTITSYSWTFPSGSPSTSNSSSPGSISYSTPGTYTATARATNQCGTDSAQRTFTVHALPSLNLGKSVDTICINNGNFVLTGYSPSGGTWSGTAISSGGTFNPSTSGVGNFKVKYSYTDGNGCTDTLSKNIKVLDKPTVKFSFNNRCIDTAIQFIDSSTAPAASISSRKWYFGDGNTSTATNPTHSYAADGIYTVKLVVYNSIGCVDSLSQNVTIYPKASLSYFINDSIQCISGNNFIYTNTSTIASGTISSYTWKFGDTATSTAASPSHAYADTGSYQVKLIAVSNRGCKDSLIKIMKVLNGPSVSFTINDTDQCLTGNSFVYNSTSTANGGTITNYNWNFGNGNISTSGSPTAQTYISSGTFPVKLIITNSKGCKDSLTKNIKVYPQPLPGFTFGGNSFCAPFSSSVTNTTIGTATWKWSISNATGATISNDTAKQPTFNFPDNQTGTDSNYIVKLIATNSDGCKDSFSVSLTIKSRPKTIYNLANDSCGPIIININNTSLYATGYSWSINPSATFSNASVASPTLTLPVNQSGSNINYAVKLITSLNNCYDTLIKNIQVFSNPFATFNMSNTDSCGPIHIYFTNNSTPGGITYNWDYGNGKSSTAKDSNLIYTNPGVNDSIYSIKLIVSSAKGCMDDTIRTLKVRPNAKASFSATNTSGCAPFTINTSVISTNIYTQANYIYTWYANGTSLGSGTSFPGYNISNANDSVLIKLKVSSLKGCKNDSTEMWFKTITNPTPGFNRSDTTGCNPLYILFKNTSTPSGLSFKWEFGNATNTSTTSDSVNYTFTNSGNTDTTWKVKLIALAGVGCKDSITKNIIVHPSSKPTFSINSNYCAPTAVIPTNTTPATPNVSVWHWKILYGGNIYKEVYTKNPTFNFADNQTLSDSIFTIRLITTTADSCADSTEQLLNIRSRPKVKYIADSVCQGYATTFIDSSSFPTAVGNLYKYYFGDGDSASIATPTHSYTTGGLYNNLLRITSSYGCIDTLTQKVTVYQKPTPTFTISASSCAPVSLNPTNTTAAVPTISNWNWNVFNNGIINRIYNAKNPTIIFPDNQTGNDSIFNVRLIATTSNGCIDSVKTSITIKTRPVATFTADTASCSPKVFGVTNSSLYTNTHAWSINPATGAGISNTTTATPNFTFTLYNDSVIRNYNIQYIATTTGGCKDTLIKTFKLYPSPVANYNLSRTDTCGPVNISIRNTSVPYNGLTYNWDYGNQLTGIAKDTNIIYNNNSINDSIYHLLLTTSNIYNCIDTQSAQLIVWPDAKALYTASDSVGCAPYSIPTSKITPSHFANANSIYKWFLNGTQLGANQTGAGLSFPGTSINNPNDSVLISMVAISKNGCKNDTMKIWFRTIPNPKPNFIRSDSVGCHPFMVNFTDTSSPSGGLSYSWDFGNGIYSVLKNPSNILFTNTGNIDSVYITKLVVSAGSGCKDSISKTIRVKPLPNPNFNTSKDTICYPNTISVTNISSNTPSIQSYLWKTNGGSVILNDTTSTSSTITFPDNQTGSYISYTIKQIATSPFSCIDSVDKNVVLPTRPIAAFHISPDSSCGPKIFSITNNSQYATGYLYTTSHKNINISNPVAFQPTITIPENKGTADSIYIIKLIATSAHGCIDSVTDTVVVHPRPKAAFTADSTYSCGPILVTFTNNSSGNSTLSYQWSFGDGGNSNTPHPTHIFNPSGYQDTSYTTQLIATTIYGCADTVSSIIKVKPSPTAQIKLSDTLICTYTLNPAQVFIYNHSIGNVDTFYYDFGDGTKLKTTSTATQNHIYANEGHYVITLTTYNECNTSVDSAKVTVLEIPHVKFVLSDTVTCDSFITITNITSNSLQTNYISYHWNFGDGTTSNVVQPGVKAYSRNISGKDSIYIISLTAFSICDTIVYYDTVKIRPIPFANFNPSKQTGCSPMLVAMYNQSLGVDSSAAKSTNYFVWNWGDGSAVDTIYSRKNLTHIYNTGITDTFTIRIWASNECGIDSEQHEVIVYPNTISPFVSISPANGMGCNPLTVTFTNNTTGANTFTWNFDSVNTANSRHTSWTFTKADSFSVAMTASNGCSDTTVYIPIIVTDPPIINFKDSGEYCQPGTIYFTNLTTSANSYTWYFGDGDTSIAKHPQHIYTAPGTYTVKLVARNVNIYGLVCTDTLKKNITIYNKPKASLVVDTAKGCETFFPKFTAAASLFTNNYNWNFGNGATSNLLNPSPGINTAGRDTFYQVRLIVSNNNNCFDTAYRTITVYAKPKADFTRSDSFDCYPAQINYINTSGFNAYSALWKFNITDTSTSFNFTNYIYNKPGNYNTRLVVTTLFGCKDSIQKSLVIGGNDTLKITTTDTILCLGKTGVYKCPISNPQFVKWDFGNGDTASGKTVNHSWNAAGNYQVIMTMTGPDGCIDSAIKNIQINPLPNVSFTINDTDQCVNQQSFIYTNTSSAAAGISGYIWKLGDATTTNTVNVNKTYIVSGTYIVTLQATTNQGCIDSTKKSVIVFPKPTPAFTINDSDQCINGNSFKFTNGSVISSGTINYIWSYGDGNSSISTSPTYSYSDSGTYRVWLNTTSNFGCIDSISKNVYIRVKPDVSFVANDTQFCVNGNIFQFANSSTIFPGSMTYQWNFGDGNTTTNVSPNHTYSNHGNYNVKLKAVSNYGCTDSFIQAVIVWPKPTVDFNINDTNQCVNAQNFKITNNCSIAYGSMTYKIDFGDGNRQTLNSPSINHSYTNSGTYKITLLAMSDNYCNDSISKYIVVAPKPNPAFSINDTGQCVNKNQYIFSNKSTISSGTMNYQWWYGDGTNFIPSAGNGDGSKIYTTHQTYWVALKVISDLGCIDSIGKSITVYPKPTPQFVMNDTDECLLNNIFNFTNQSNIAYGTINYIWNFDDSIISFSQDPSHSYMHSDTFNVKLWVQSDLGCVDSIYKNVFVRPMPIAGFTANDTDQCVNANMVNFTNTSKIGYGVLSFDWDFDNGNTSKLLNPSEQFNGVKNYKISLLATSPFGCINSISHDIYIRPKPTAAFTLSDSDNCVLLDEKFSNQSSTDVTHWTWNFDDPTSPDNVSTIPSPQHIYYQIGVYHPQLIVENNFGCFDTTQATTKVYEDPVSLFAFLPKNACDTPINVQLFNQSNNAVKYLWNFDNGKVSSAFNPTTLYINTGTYYVSLISYTSEGCMDTLIIPYIVAAEPKGDYKQSVDSGCMPLIVNFTNRSSSAALSTWDFGDGILSNDKDPVHIYTQAGTYPIVLSVDNGNCHDTVSKGSIVVWQKPIAEFNWANTGPDRAGMVQFTDASSFAEHYIWNFDDGKLSNDTNPFHRYDLHGDYQVMQTVYTDKGCYDSIVHPLHIELMKGLFVANAFTPEDNLNDARLFKPKGIGLMDYKVRVFTTWGELVWESSELENTRPKEGWDGTWKGHPCKQDVYVWKIEATFLDGSVWPGKKMPNGTYSTIGTVTLIR